MEWLYLLMRWVPGMDLHAHPPVGPAPSRARRGHLLAWSCGLGQPTPWVSCSVSQASDILLKGQGRAQGRPHLADFRLTLDPSPDARVTRSTASEFRTEKSTSLAQTFENLPDTPKRTVLSLSCVLSMLLW